MTVAPEKDLLSTGKLCEVLQASPNRIERAAAKAGVAPALRLNGIVYYSDESLERIRTKLQRGQK